MRVGEGESKSIREFRDSFKISYYFEEEVPMSRYTVTRKKGRERREEGKKKKRRLFFQIEHKIILDNFNSDLKKK